MTRDLVERAMNGDRDAFGVLASRSLRRLVGTAGLILRSHGAADDVAQEALIRAWRDLPTLRDPDRFEGWLYRVLVRACHDHWRRQGSRPTPRGLGDSRPLTVADPADAVVDRAAIDAALARLTPDQRTVLVLRYYLDLTLDDIADAVGVPVGTVKSRIHRSLDAMQAAMAAEARRPARERTT